MDSLGKKIFKIPLTLFDSLIIEKILESDGQIEDMGEARVHTRIIDKYLVWKINEKARLSASYHMYKMEIVGLNIIVDIKPSLLNNVEFINPK